MNILKKSLIIVFSVLLITGACKNSSKSDNSLTVEEYMELGMPDPNKVWAYKDYIEAYNTLDNLSILAPFSFPMKINNSKVQSDIRLQSGQGAIIHSYINLISKLLQEQLNVGVYLNTDLDRFSLEISHSLTKNLSLIKPAYGQRLIDLLQDVIQKSPSDVIKKNYQKTLEAFKNE